MSTLPDAVQIVDRFHAKQKLSDVAKSIYGAGSDLGKQWARQRHDELDAMPSSVPRGCAPRPELSRPDATAIGVRCKRAGMHWTVAGAVIALRCCKLSGRFEDFWERRAQLRPAA
jgi:hypothetical protein